MTKSGELIILNATSQRERDSTAACQRRPQNLPIDRYGRQSAYSCRDARSPDEERLGHRRELPARHKRLLPRTFLSIAMGAALEPYPLPNLFQAPTSPEARRDRP